MKLRELVGVLGGASVPRTPFFFATKADLGGWSGAISQSRQVTFVLANVGASREGREYGSLADIPLIGVSPYGKSMDGVMCLVALAGTRVIVEPTQVADKELWSVSQERNPRSVWLWSPGIHAQSKSLIAGQAATINAMPESLQILRAMRIGLSRSFRKEHRYLFGQEAWLLAKHGWRCTHDIESPAKYDVHVT